MTPIPTITDKPKEEKPSAEDWRLDFTGKTITNCNVFSLENASENVKTIVFEIHSRNPIFGLDNQYFLKAHHGVFGMGETFISNMKPISMDGKYEIEYQGIKYEMSITEDENPSLIKIAIKRRS